MNHIRYSFCFEDIVPGNNVSKNCKRRYKYTNNQIVVNIPNVRKPIPLFIVMRALGILSDKIIEMCLIDLKDMKTILIYLYHQFMMQKYLHKMQLLNILQLLQKVKRESCLEILMDYFYHIGVDNFIDKAYFLDILFLTYYKFIKRLENY